MAYFRPQDEQQDTGLMTNAGSGTLGGGMGTAPGAGAPRPAAGPVGTGFVNLQDVLKLNGPQAQGMADRVQSGVQGEVNQTNTDLNAKQAQLSGLHSTTMAKDDQGIQNEAYGAAADARAAGSQGGLQQLLGKFYGNGQPYSAGESRMDAFLTGAAGGSKLQGLGGQYGAPDLSGVLGQSGNGLNPTPKPKVTKDPGDVDEGRDAQGKRFQRNGYGGNGRYGF